jgi:hypothetical protein
MIDMNEQFREMSKKNLSKRKIIYNIGFNLIMPLLTYTILSQIIKPNLAIFIVALIPLFTGIYTIIKNHKINRFSVIALVILMLGGFALLITGKEQWLLVKGSLFSGIVGIVLIISSIVNRPLLVYLLRLRAKSSNDLKHPTTLHQRLANTLVPVNWILGMYLTIEAMVHIYLVFHVSTTRYLEISPILRIINIGMMLLMVLWVKRVAKHT